MPTPPGFAQVSVEMQQATVSRPAYITFGVDPTDTDPLLVGAAIGGTIAAAGSLVSMLDSSVTVTAVRVSLGTDGGEDIVGIHPMSLPGTTTKTALPPNCAMLVHKVTTRGGRRGRGRLFLPWVVSENNCDEGGIIDSSVLTSSQTALGVWRAGLATAQCPMVILHDPSPPGTVHPTTPGAPNLVTSLVADRLISTQRRRLGR